MKKSTKNPLDFDQYEKYSIDQNYSAYTIVFENIDPLECDDLEYEYLSKGYKLFSSELLRLPQGKVSLTLIVAKIEAIF